MIPEDPLMLFSFINTKLRDFYPTLSALCDDMNINETTIIAKLESAGFTYNPSLNKFW